MKRLIIFLTVTFFTLSAEAQELSFSKKDMFKIKEMNIEEITIDGKPLIEEGVFDCSKTIEWRGTEGDYFNALWVNHNRYFTFEYNKNIGNGRTAIHYIKSNKTLHKGAGYAKDVLNDIFYAVSDTLYMPPVSELIDEDHYFIFRHNGMKHRIPCINKHELYICLPEYQFNFNEDGIVKLRVSYISKDPMGNENETSVTSGMIITKINLK